MSYWEGRLDMCSFSVAVLTSSVRNMDVFFNFWQMKTWDSPKNGDVDLGTALQQECLRRGKLLLHSEAMGKVYKQK